MTTSRVGPRFARQREFLACPATFALYGGAAGGGKTAALCLDPLRSLRDPHFRGTLVRRKSKDHGMGGGLWDEANKLWGPSRAVFKQAPRSARWGSGARIDFQYPEPGSNYQQQFQGLQSSWVGYDEMSHFDWPVVSYIFGRQRPRAAGAQTYIRGASNPDPESFLLDFVEPYLDSAGYADRSKSGQVRWWARHRDSDEIVHGASRAEVRRNAKTDDARVFSFAFFPALATDNVVLMAHDPDYAAKLSLTRVLEERLEKGNWYVRQQNDGMLAEKRWQRCQPDDVPLLAWRCRGWDKAATVPSETSPDPDYSVSVNVGGTVDGRVFVGLGDRGVTALRDVPGQVMRHIRQTASLDGPGVVQSIPIDPGGAGKVEEALHREKLRGPQIGPLELLAQRGSKTVRATPLSHALEQGRAYIVAGPWMDQVYRDPKVRTTLGRLWWSHMDPFPDGKHDDFADAAASAFNYGRAKRPYQGGDPGFWKRMRQGLTRDAW